MATLYVTTPGATVRCRGESLVVVATETPRDDRSARNGRPDSIAAPNGVELHRLELLALVGRVHLTAEAMFACQEHGVQVAYLSRTGRLRARLVPEAPRAGDLRLAQYRAHDDPRRRLDRARAVVAAKATGAAAVLRAFRSNRERDPVLATALGRLRTAGLAIAACPALEALRGWEGVVARTYFRALATTFRAPFHFPGRRRRPPPDPVNALLSFGYVLLANHLAGRLEARGLDPALGFYHEVHPGRPSLALDLLEEFRHPVVDRLVTRLVNLRALRPDHFEPDPERPGGVRLTRDGLGRFFEAWEWHLRRPCRDADGPHRLDVFALIDRQVERLVADLRGGPPQSPLPPRRLTHDPAPAARRDALRRLLRRARHPPPQPNRPLPR